MEGNNPMVPKKSRRPALRPVSAAFRLPEFRPIERAHFSPADVRRLKRQVLDAIPGIRAHQEMELAKLRKTIVAARRGRDFARATRLEGSMLKLVEHHLRLLAEPRLGYIGLLYQEYALRALERRLGADFPPELRVAYRDVVAKKTRLWSVQGMEAPGP